MNKARRQKISNTIKTLQQVLDNLSSILLEEEIAHDSMPENLQYSIKGEESEEAINIISESIDILHDVCGNLESI